MNGKRHIGFEIRMLDNMIKRGIETKRPKELEDSTGYHGWALRYFAENADKEIYQKDFEEKFSVRRSTATKILQLMEKNGVIVRQSVKSDARLKKIVLTDKGMSIHLSATESINGFENTLSKGISDTELDAFFKTIDKIKQNLEENNA